MNTYMFEFERHNMRKQSPIIRAETLQAAAHQIQDLLEEGWIVTAVTENGTSVPEDQWPASLESPAEQLKDEFSDIPVECPECGKMATSVNKTGSKIFYNHGEARLSFKDSQQVEAKWSACEVDRPIPKKKS
jgi:hypothetical protein